MKNKVTFFIVQIYIMNFSRTADNNLVDKETTNFTDLLSGENQDSDYYNDLYDHPVEYTENVKRIFYLDRNITYKTNLYRVKKNYEYYAYYRTRGAYIIYKRNLKFKADCIRAGKLKKFTLDKYNNKKMRIILKGIKQFSEFFLLLGFDINYKKFFLVFQNFVQLSIKIKFKRFNSIIQEYINDCMSEVDLPHATMYLDPDELIVTAEYKEKHNNFLVFIIIACKNASKFLYMEINFFDVKITNWTYITINNKQKDNELTIKYFDEYLYIKNNQENYIIPTNNLLKDVERFDITKYLVEFDAEIIDIFYLSRGNFVVLFNNRYRVYNIKYIGENLLKFVAWRYLYTLDCSNNHNFIYTKEYLGCVTIEATSLVLHTYYVVGNLKNKKFTYKLYVGNNFEVTDSFIYKEDYFKRYIIMAFGDTIVSVFYEQDVDDQAVEGRFVSKAFVDNRTNNLEIPAFNHIKQSIDVYNYFGKDFAKIDVMNYGKGILYNNKYTKYTRILNKKITNPTNIMGFGFKDVGGMPFSSVIISTKYQNYFFENSEIDNRLVKKKGILVNQKIQEYYYFLDNIFIEFEHSFGHFNFKNSNVFMEVRWRPSDYELFLPINIDQSRILYFALDTDKIQIKTFGSIIYTKYLTEFNYRIEFPIFKYTYDEYYPNYIYIIDADQRLFAFEIIYTKFIFIEIFSIKTDIDYYQLYYFKNFKNNLIYLYSSHSTEAHESSHNILKVVEVNTTDDGNYKVIKNKELPNKLCRYFQPQLLISRQNNNFNSEYSACLLFCFRNHRHNEDELLYVNLDDDKKLVPLHLSTGIMAKLKDPNRSKMGVLRFKYSKTIVDVLVVMYNEAREQMSLIDIIHINSKPKIKIEIQNNEDIIDSFEGYITHDFYNKPQKMTAIKINSNCFFQQSYEISEHDKDNTAKGFQINKTSDMTEINIYPQHIFKGIIHNYELRLNDGLENFYKTMEVKSLMQKIYERPIIPASCRSVLTPCFYIQDSNTLLLNDPKEKHIIQYNIDYYPNPDQKYQKLNKYKSLFYLRESFSMVIDNNNEVYVKDNLNARNIFITKLNFDYYDANMYAFGQNYVLLLKTESSFESSNVQLIFRHKEENEDYLELINPINQKNTMEVFSCIEISDDLQAIITIKEPMNINMYNYRISRKYGVLVKQTIELDKFFINEEVIDYYIKAFKKVKMKCIAFSYSEDQSVLFGCLLTFEHADSLLLHMKYSNEKYYVTSIERLYSFYFSSQFKIDNYGCLLSNNYAVTYYVVDKQLHIYFYRISRKNDCKKENIEYLRYDFCYAETSPEILDPSFHYKVTLLDKKLRDIYLDNKYLVILTDDRLLKYDIGVKFTIKLSKTNLSSRYLMIKAQNPIDSKTFDIQLDEVKMYNICELISL